MQKSKASLPTLRQWLDEATQQLTDHHIASARLDAEIILAHTLNKPRTFVHAHADEPLNERHYEIANARIDLRLDHVPIAYIIGHKEFYGRSFKVSVATLIPRPESEIMIELLKEIDSLDPVYENKRLVDVGTGSGNLGITAKLELPELSVTLLDKSRHALTIAEYNANHLHASVDIVRSDLLKNYPHKAHYILANLPYVDKEWEGLSPDLLHEPASALFADNHGLALIRRLLQTSPLTLDQDGYLFIEADPEQHLKIIDEANRYGLIVTLQKDYQIVLRKTL